MSAKGGRRAEQKDTIASDNVEASETKATEGDRPNKPAVTAGGWGFEKSTKGGESKSGEKSGGMTSTSVEKPDSFENERENNKKNVEEDTIMIIPDLDDDNKDEILNTIAVAPKNNQRRVQSLNELDDYNKTSLPSSSSSDSGSSGVALALLTASLSPLDALQEGDDLWDFDVMLQELSQQMQAEAELLSSTKEKENISKPSSENDPNKENIVNIGTRRRGVNNEVLFAKYSSTADISKSILDDDGTEGK